MTPLEKIEALEAELAKLKANLQPKKTPCFTPEDGERYWQIMSATHRDGTLYADDFYHNPPKVAFRDAATAEAYAEALNVMLELRLYADGGRYYLEDTTKEEIAISETAFDFHSASAFSGQYSTKEQAKLAIKSVGEERIIAAIKTLCGVV